MFIAFPCFVMRAFVLMNAMSSISKFKWNDLHFMIRHKRFLFCFVYVGCCFSVLKILTRNKSANNHQIEMGAMSFVRIERKKWLKTHKFHSMCQYLSILMIRRLFARQLNIIGNCLPYTIIVKFRPFGWL